MKTLYNCINTNQTKSLNPGKEISLWYKIIWPGKKQIPAHRLVLSAGSEYFSAMFTSNLRESNQSEIVLQDVDGDALWDLVHYCYTGIVIFYPPVKWEYRNLIVIEYTLHAWTIVKSSSEDHSILCAQKTNVFAGQELLRTFLMKISANKYSFHCMNVTSQNFH